MHRWKVHLVGYNYVADIKGLSTFIKLLLPAKIAKSREIPIKFDLTLYAYNVVADNTGLSSFV